MLAPLPDNELQRLEALRRYAILDTVPESTFDDFTSLASFICQTPVALISLVDADRQWYKSRIGIAEEQASRAASFCAHAILETDKMMIVEDVQADPRFAENALVVGEPHVRFYAGAPLLTPDGHALGTLCVLDRKPRQLNRDQVAALQKLSAAIMDHLELRRVSRELTQSQQALEALNSELQAGSRERAERFNHLLAQMNDVAWITSADGTQVLDVNDAFEKVYGVPAARFVADPNLWRSMVHPDDRAIADASNQEVLNTGRAAAEYRIVRPDGEVRWILDKKAVMYSDNGSPARLGGIASDITERRQAQATIEQLLRQNELILQSAGKGIFGLDLAGRVTFANNTGAHLLGYTPEELIGRVQHSLIHHTRPDGRPYPTEECPVHATMATGNINQRDDDVFWRKDGASFPVAYVSSPIRSEQGRIAGAVVIFEDITERRRVEESLRLNAAMMANVAAGIYLVRASDETIIYTNPRFDSVFGYAPGEALGLHVSALNAPTERTPLEIANEISLALKTHGAWQSEIRSIRKDGASFWTHASMVTFQHAVHGLVWVAARQDITDRKLAEENLRLTRDRLQTIFDASPLSILGIAPDGRILNWNKGAERMFGWTEAEAVGQFCPTVPEDGLADFHDMLGRIMKGETITDLVRLRKKKSGEVIHASINGSAVRDEAGRNVGAIALLQDISERKRAEDQSARQLHHLKSLNAIDNAIANSFDLSLTANVIVQQTSIDLGADAVGLLLLNPHTHMLESVAGLGFRTRAMQKARLRLGEGFSGRAALERRVIHVRNLGVGGQQFALVPDLKPEGFVSYIGAPLVAKGQVKGVLEVFQRSPLEATPEWQEFFEALAGQAAIAIDSAQSFEGLQRSHVELSLAYDATIEGWSRAMDLRDKETEGHTQRVTDMTVRLARLAGMNEEDIIHVRRGALLHDMGKLGVPDSILLKPGKLSEEEWALMQRHPQYAFEMLSPISYLQKALAIPYCHHEKWDGTGYPRGLKGEQIPLEARLFAVVDVWDALRSDRPYRAAWPEQRVLEHIRALAGTHFDPRAVELFAQAQQDRDYDPR